MRRGATREVLVKEGQSPWITAVIPQQPQSQRFQPTITGIAKEAGVYICAMMGNTIQPHLIYFYSTVSPGALVLHLEKELHSAHEVKSHCI